MRNETSSKKTAKAAVATLDKSVVLSNEADQGFGLQIGTSPQTAIESNPNTAQSRKAEPKTKVIGLILADILNPFSSGLARIIADEAEKLGYLLVYGSSDESCEKEKKLVDAFLEKRVNGLIIMPCEKSRTQVLELADRRVPFVLLDRYFPDIAVNHVAVDNFQASYLAVNHLIDHGSKRIGMISLDTGFYHMQERKRGYIRALEDAQRAINSEYILELKADFDQRDVGRAVDALLTGQAPVDAVYLATNMLAVSGLRHIHSRKIKVPEDIAVVTFDETEFLDLFSTPLTQLRQPMAEMGRAAIEILISTIENESKLAQVNLQPLLLVRGSSLPVSVQPLASNAVF